MINRLLKLKYVILFLILAQLVIISIVSIITEENRNNYLKDKTNLAKIEYETIYWKIKEQSTMIFQELINTKDIINIYKNAYSSNEEERKYVREELYQKLLPSYNRLKKLIKIRQVHFHLPNNHSFLRMHRPSVFGDDLSEVRETVNYVNQYKKPIDGFEEGRIYNGFRFVYPLFDEAQNYLGSVEISFSSSSFQNSLSDEIRFSQFIFLKKIVKEKVFENEYKRNYVTAAISPLFLLEANWEKSKYSDFKKKIQKKVSLKIKSKFANNVSLAKPYSLDLEVQNRTIVLSFLPIKNPVSDKLSAYLIVISKSSHLEHISTQRTILIFVSFALLLSLFIIIYRRNKHEDDIKEQNKLLLEQSKMAQMGSMLSNIAHQWKQPLARINSKLIEIPLTLSLDKKNEEILDKHLEQIEDFTLYMSNTIDNFRTYSQTDKIQKNFYVKHAIDKAVKLLDPNSKESKIKLTIDASKQAKVHCYEDELIQVLMVLLINAKEALLENEIIDPSLWVLVKEKTSSLEIDIVDNAGGISDENAQYIFNPYFTTKESSSNDGIGLYMAKMILEGNMQGKLTYNRKDKYSHFKIILKGLINE